MYSQFFSGESGAPRGLPRRDTNRATIDNPPISRHNCAHLMRALSRTQLKNMFQANSLCALKRPFSPGLYSLYIPYIQLRSKMIAAGASVRLAFYPHHHKHKALARVRLVYLYCCDVYNFMVEFIERWLAVCQLLHVPHANVNVYMLCCMMFVCTRLQIQLRFHSATCAAADAHRFAGWE